MNKPVILLLALAAAGLGGLAFTQSQSAAVHIKTQRNCGCVMLTGTAVENRAEEIFVPLNICDPSRFSSLQAFRREFMIQEYNGKWNRISPYAMPRFKEVIKPYFLRREKARMP